MNTGEQAIHADLLIDNASELITLAADVPGNGVAGPRVGSSMRSLAIISGGSIAAFDGRIVVIGKTHEVRGRVRLTPNAEVIDAKGKVVLPGFVDSHTHLVFAGSREREFIQRAEGKTYLEILGSGGGILSTVKATRDAAHSHLLSLGIENLDIMMCHGTTTVEIKSGYGLSVDEELKILRIIKELDKLHPVDVVSTFMGAHAVSAEYAGDAEGYVQHVINDMLPAVKDENLAEFCDVFCEKGVFSVDQSRRILEAGLAFGLLPRIHADELGSSGGAELAAEIGAVSAEHLLYASEEGIRKMAEAGVTATLLPATSFTLGLGRYADARAFIQAGCPVALATDFNPGTSPTLSMQFVMNVAALGMKLHPAEIICASTINAACGLNRGNLIGSLEVGKAADMVVLDVDTYLKIPYKPGTNIVDKVIKKGRLVVSEGRRIPS
ncbi:MAG: imidazolonepropionase [Firmicutes bacterium]|nr:imidazolonepropionase [Bacillota bacterium]